MKERVTKIGTDLKTFWSSRSKTQKITMIGSSVGILLLAIVLTIFLSRTDYVPLYSDVSRAEVGRIKEHLDSMGVPNQVAPGGSANLVPKERVDDLLVTLAMEGFPKSGAIDSSFFAENAGFGTTDNEFNMLKKATLETELANLIRGIEGVRDAQVMITLPAPSVFVSELTEDASAAVILKTEAGNQFNDAQMTALYHLISKSLQNLSPENIALLNQYGEVFDFVDPSQSTGASVADQRAVKKSIEKDIQNQVQQMLGLLMGRDKVVVTVSTDIDFKTENRQENLVYPVDEENMEGLTMSAQRITETFTGNGPGAMGTPATEDGTDNATGSFVEGAFGNGDYERFEETLNNEVNRVRKEIVESPYKVKDIGITVIIDPPRDEQGELTDLPQNLQADVEQILTTIVRTSINKEQPGELTDELIAEKIAVSIQPFNGAPEMETPPTGLAAIPLWVYILLGIVLLIIIGLVVLFLRNKKKTEELELEQAIEEQQEVLSVDDINKETESETTLKSKQLEKMARERPEEFAKLLRTWISED